MSSLVSHEQLPGSIVWTSTGNALKGNLQYWRRGTERSGMPDKTESKGSKPFPSGCCQHVVVDGAAIHVDCTPGTPGRSIQRFSRKDGPRCAYVHSLVTLTHFELIRSVSEQVFMRMQGQAMLAVCVKAYHAGRFSSQR